mmetsp:Transcript_19962/g.51899  ORF Transcript_19962/g.51899 Transcript_19962/m.51899 type:complete len:248 (-) Transcript_19962:139-882(-)
MQGAVQMQSQPVVMPPAPVMPPAGPAQVQVQIPPGLAPGQVFQVNANGQLISVTVPAGCPPGAVLAVAVPPPPAVSLQPPPPAVSLQPQPAPVMPPAAPQSVVEVPVPAGLTMGSVFHVQVNGMTIPVTVPAPGLPPGTRLNVAGLPSAEAIQAKDERAPGDMTVCKPGQNLTKGGCTIPANRNAYKDAQRQNIPPPGAAVGGEWIQTPGCCFGTYTVYAANGVEYWCPDRNEGDAIMYACDNSGDY